MDRHKSIFNPRNLIICVTTCTIAVVWAVILVTLYFYFFGGPYTTVVHNVTEVQAVQLIRHELLPWYLNGSLQPFTTPDDDLVPLFSFQQTSLHPLERLHNQLMFLPKGSSETKIILFWSDWSPTETEEFKVPQCPVRSCVFTNSRKSFSKANAIVFRNTTKLLTGFPDGYRPRSQVWIFNSLSAPGLEFVHPRDVFNWTATPRLDSTVPMFPYGMWMYYNPLWKHQDPPFNLVEHKSLGAAAWFPEWCEEQSRAYRYVSRLLHYTLVDIFSSHPSCAGPGVDLCPQDRNHICLKLLRDKYRVTLVLDNVMCNHTIPRMFYLALEANTVPVVMSPPRTIYEQLVPEGSFIHVDDFATPRDLAYHLETIYKDDAVFNKYLSWQGTGLFVKTWYCRICALLHHNNLPDLAIEDINQWWNPEGECIS